MHSKLYTRRGIHMTRDAHTTRRVRNAMRTTRDARDTQKRALSVAKRPREIYSAKARRQDAIFFRKMKNPKKHSHFQTIFMGPPP
jgi:hypothetical protein